MEVPMKRVFVTAAVLVVSLGLGGCAGSTRSGMVSKGHLDEDSIDFQKVATVNQWARERGHHVEWINLPQRRHVADNN
jgi:hypothetical protein